MDWDKKRSNSFVEKLPKVSPQLLLILSIIVLVLSIIASLNPYTFDPIFILFGLISLGISVYLLWFYKEEDKQEQEKKEFRLFKKKHEIEIPQI
jgi:cadmium resistance protein CadD (predicted permease)